MRTIKFRAWHGDAEDMVHFGLGEDHLQAYSLKEDQNYTLEVKGGEHPVMQFTGLHDTNGAEVYEGDIVRLVIHVHQSRPVISVNEVRFEDGVFVLKSRGILGRLSPACTTEVIGNIFEHPSLLGDSHD